MNDIWGLGRSMKTAARDVSVRVIYEAVKANAVSLLTVVVPADGFVERRQLWRGKTLCVLVPEILDLYSHDQNGAQAAAALWCFSSATYNIFCDPREQRDHDPRGLLVAVKEIAVVRRSGVLWLRHGRTEQSTTARRRFGA
jgi:hypothetical protein